ncbi:lipoprotein insertase outer membrane protein LolB [Dechloromonas sp. CZR5]|uniref:lipoprotein insertase outer membrane protein LolB n=1 Tax=Dechloromonas sp. CZR5 TaxID=2608630 RepID=UPI00168AF18E|nr:lipoprotein insertase outer membrane protein LolB [Dechloromonas sp. CZR5]
MIRRCIPLLALGLLAGCAGLPPAAPLDRDSIRDFALEARFALRATPSGQSPQSANGRLTWTHTGQRDRVLLASPLGYGLAEIDITPQRSTLRTGDGQESESSDPEELITTATGLPLPVSRLPAWLLGRSGSAATVEPDARGRPGRLIESGWQIDYAYDNDRAAALPARLTIIRPGEVELKLRIEEWRETP